MSGPLLGNGCKGAYTTVDRVAYRSARGQGRERGASILTTLVPLAQAKQRGNPIDCRVCASPLQSAGLRCGCRRRQFSSAQTCCWCSRSLLDRQDSLRSDYMSDRDSRYGIVQQASIESTDSRLCYLTSSEVSAANLTQRNPTQRKATPPHPTQFNATQPNLT